MGYDAKTAFARAYRGLGLMQEGRRIFCLPVLSAASFRELRDDAAVVGGWDAVDALLNLYAIRANSITRRDIATKYDRSWWRLEFDYQRMKIWLALGARAQWQFGIEGLHTLSLDSSTRTAARWLAGEPAGRSPVEAGRAAEFLATNGFPLRRTLQLARAGGIPPEMLSTVEQAHRRHSR